MKLKLLFPFILLSYLPVKTMEQSKLPLPKEQMHFILRQQESFFDILKGCLVFASVCKEAKTLIHDDGFISQLSSEWNTDKTLTALLLGKKGDDEVEAKKAMLLKYATNGDVIDNYKIYYCDENNRYVSNLKFTLEGMLTLVKLKLAYNKGMLFKTIAKADELTVVRFLFDKKEKLNIECDLNSTLFAATKKLAYKALPLLLSFGADPQTKNEQGSTPLLKAIRHNGREKDSKSMHKAQLFLLVLYY
jgi:hypothetical protein